jgi:hypothetical protein
MLINFVHAVTFCHRPMYDRHATYYDYQHFNPDRRMVFKKKRHVMRVSLDKEDASK